MKNLVICGTSGVGKTFLEEYLESQNLSYQLPKYFDRNNRPGERKDKNVSMSQERWMSTKKEFFFTLSYNNNNYGWKRADFKKNKVATLAITLESLSSFIKVNKDFMPILLWVELDNLELLRRRMKNRGEKKEKIEQRLKLAKIEIKKGNVYKKIIRENKGLIITIKDDKTIFKELIPRIKAIKMI